MSTSIESAFASSATRSSLSCLIFFTPCAIFCWWSTRISRKCAVGTRWTTWTSLSWWTLFSCEATTRPSSRSPPRLKLINHAMFTKLCNSEEILQNIFGKGTSRSHVALNPADVGRQPSVHSRFVLLSARIGSVGNNCDENPVRHAILRHKSHHRSW